MSVPVPIPMSEVEKHGKEDDCWLVINKQVYNLTSFINEHPGGVQVIASCQPTTSLGHVISNAICMQIHTDVILMYTSGSAFCCC